MSEDSGQQPEQPPAPDLGYVPGQPFPPHGQPFPPYGQAGSPQPPGPAYPVYVLPDAPKATAALVVGIISVAGFFLCVLPVLAAPVAWVLGAQARREIRRAPHQFGGDGKATAGMVLGIVGTVLLVLALVFVVIIIVIVATDPSTFDSNTSV